MNEAYPVLNVEWKTPRVFELTVKRNGLKFSPGDSVALYTQKKQDSRPYSIASGVDEPVMRFLIQHMPNGTVSGYLSELKPGETVGISEPFGWFRPGQNIDGTPFIFIATGTGIAPFISYLRAYPERPPQVLLYGVRKLEDAIDLGFLQSICPVQIAISQESVAPHRNGRVTDLLPTLSFNPGTTHFYLCGLDAMIENVSDTLEKSGVPFANIHREVFFYAPS